MNFHQGLKPWSNQRRARETLFESCSWSTYRWLEQFFVSTRITTVKSVGVYLSWQLSPQAVMAAGKPSYQLASPRLGNCNAPSNDEMLPLGSPSKVC